MYFFTDCESISDNAELLEAAAKGDCITLFQLLDTGQVVGNKALLLALKNGHIQAANLLQTYLYYPVEREESFDSLAVGSMHLFNLIFNSAMLEINRLRYLYGSREKDHVRKIFTALARLLEALMAKQGEYYRSDYLLNRLKDDVCTVEIMDMKLSTIDNMMNARFFTWMDHVNMYWNLSLCEALNHEGETRLNYMGFTWGSFFGKTKALVNVERVLSGQTTLFKRSPHMFRPTFRPEDNIINEFSQEQCLGSGVNGVRKGI